MQYKIFTLALSDIIGLNKSLGEKLLFLRDGVLLNLPEMPDLTLPLPQIFHFLIDILPFNKDSMRVKISLCQFHITLEGFAPKNWR